jgi:cytochrome c5
MGANYDFHSFEVSKLRFIAMSNFIFILAAHTAELAWEIPMKRLQFCLLALAASVAFLTVTQTAAAQKLDGKELYRNNCRVCHDKGSPNGQYTPMTLTQDQWKKFFNVKLIPAHKDALHPKTGGKLLEGLTPDQLKAIQKFAVDHAADSEQPATCG